MSYQGEPGRLYTRGKHNRSSRGASISRGNPSIWCGKTIRDWRSLFIYPDHSVFNSVQQWESLCHGSSKLPGKAVAWLFRSYENGIYISSLWQDYQDVNVFWNVLLRLLLFLSLESWGEYHLINIQATLPIWNWRLIKAFIQSIIYNRFVNSWMRLTNHSDCSQTSRVLITFSKLRPIMNTWSRVVVSISIQSVFDVESTS